MSQCPTPRGLSLRGAAPMNEGSGRTTASLEVRMRRDDGIHRSQVTALALDRPAGSLRGLGDSREWLVAAVGVALLLLALLGS